MSPNYQKNRGDIYIFKMYYNGYMPSLVYCVTCSSFQRVCAAGLKLVLMATLFVWYDGNVLQTWHYNSPVMNTRYLVSQQSSTITNILQPEILRNVITVNLSQADVSARIFIVIYTFGECVHAASTIMLRFTSKPTFCCTLYSWKMFSPLQITWNTLTKLIHRYAQ